MKKKLVEHTLPVPAAEENCVTVQKVENILILNIFENRKLSARYCINLDTNEYMTLKDGIWHEWKLQTAVGLGEYWHWTGRDVDRHMQMSDKDSRRIREYLGCMEYLSVGGAIDRMEDEYSREKRERKEENRIGRVSALMNRVPPVPDGIKSWLDQKAGQGMEYLIWGKGSVGIYGCSACGGKFTAQDLPKKVKDQEMTVCPGCGQQVKVLRRRKSVRIQTRFVLIQPVDDEISVIRYFDAVIWCPGHAKKEILLDEAIRQILFKDRSHKYAFDYYFAQESKYPYPSAVRKEVKNFDNKSNWFGRKTGKSYLYDGGIREALKDTVCERWTGVFSMLAGTDLMLEYSNMAVNDPNYSPELVEMLYKGRFFRLLEETVGEYRYTGPLNMSGRKAEEVFRIRDRQKINRIRDRNGGELQTAWMQWSDMEGRKLSDRVLDWLHENRITQYRLIPLLEHMSPEQIMNYIQRQQAESYVGKKAAQVLEQYIDYMGMCEKLHKNMQDAMVYRPRELKRRHDEAVAELEQRKDELEAEKYSEKFSEAEAVLRSVREKFEYTGSGYQIIVPQRIVDIVADGRALHHCAGATDRYFDRIKQEETYICFLRKEEEPDQPYYTIEVEPGGTIRQHRGMYDEEPEIEKIRPFLKEWQQVIRRRMKARDHELEKVARKKREENLEDLRRKNNTRVLDGLMEDFMEAI